MPTEHILAAAGRDTVRILLADDHPVLREGIALLIGTVPGWEICGTAGDGAELIEEALELRPDVIVLDLHMPRLDGTGAVRELKERLPDTEIVIFSGARAETVVHELFDAGAKSFVSKCDDPALLITAIRSAAVHRPFLTPSVAEILFRRALNSQTHAQPSGGQLTQREREIVMHIADGKANREIAVALGISSRTAETHRATIMRKVHASSTAELVRYAIRDGIIEA